MEEDLGEEPPFNPFSTEEDPGPETGDVETPAISPGLSRVRRWTWPKWLMRTWADWSTFELLEVESADLPLEELRYRKWCARGDLGV